MAPRRWWANAWAKWQSQGHHFQHTSESGRQCVCMCVHVCSCHRGKWWQTMANWSEGFPLLAHHANRESETMNCHRKWQSKTQMHTQTGKWRGQVSTKASKLQRVSGTTTVEYVQKDTSLKASISTFPLEELILFFIYQRLSQHCHLRLAYTEQIKIHDICKFREKTKVPFFKSPEGRNDEQLNHSVWPKSISQHSKKC